MSASLLARNLSLSYGGAVVLDARRRGLGPDDPHGRRRAERHRQDHAAQGARRPRASRWRDGRGSRRPDATVGYLPQEPERRTGRDGAGRRWPGAPASPRPTPSSTPPRPRSPPAEPAPTTATATALDRWLPARRGRLRRAAAAAVAADLGLSDAVLDQPMTTLSGGQAARVSLAGDPAGALRRPPARRAHQRPRLRRPRPARAVPRRRGRRRR